MQEAGRSAKRGGPTGKKRPGAGKLAAVSDPPSVDATRRTEILKTANTVIATTGLRSSLQQIADAAGILAGSLYHHFESKEAILVELIRPLSRGPGSHRRHRARPARRRLTPVPSPNRSPLSSCAIARCAVEHRAALQMSFYEGPSNDPELIELTRRQPTKIQAAMLQTLARRPLER